MCLTYIHTHHVETSKIGRVARSGRESCRGRKTFLFVFPPPPSLSATLLLSTPLPAIRPSVHPTSVYPEQKENPFLYLSVCCKRKIHVYVCSRPENNIVHMRAKFPRRPPPPEKKALNQLELGSVFLLWKGNETKKGIVIRIRLKRAPK